MPKVIAIAVSDIHLSMLRPVCRKGDWMSVQASYLMQLKKAVREYDVPVLCAGDIFDRWNPPAELINFALLYLPEGMICVPGQHDLPNHSMSEIERSGFGVLRTAKKIIHLHDDVTYYDAKRDFIVHGFGWEEEICKPPKATVLQIALVHQYIWKNSSTSYQGASESSNVTKLEHSLKRFDVAFFGDNHKRFMARVGDCTVVNCGTFMRRKADEISYEPCIYLLMDNGTVKPELLNTSIDEFVDKPEDREEMPFDMRAFIETLEGLGEHGLDFREAVRNHLKNEDVDPNVRKYVLEALDAE
jgi:DNA repair exonuclease SbcCD nuclease subunit